MLNAATKTLAVLGLSLTAVLASCSGDNSVKEAEALYERAGAALQAGDNATALALLDSLDRRYSSAVEVRRKAMGLRSQAREALTLAQLAEADSMMVATQIHADSLSRRLSRVGNAVEDFYIVEGSSLPPTGIQARVSQEGVLYIISSLEGHPVRHTSLSLSSAAGSVSTGAVGYDGERNRREGGIETVHFVGAECDTLGRFAYDNRNTPVTLTFSGDASYSRPLTMGELDALATAWDYASSLVRLKFCALEHEKLERMLEVARSQRARTMTDTAATPR